MERLAPHEFHLLRGFADGDMPNPDRSVAIVGREQGKIVSRIFLMAPVHVEGIFIEPQYRNAHHMKQLVDAVEAEALHEGLSQVLAFGAGKDMEGYLTRLGYTRLPWSVWDKKLKGGSVA